MNPGRMSTRLVWQRLRVSDGDHGQVRTWATLGSIWGRVHSPSSRTMMQGGQLLSSGLVTIETRGENPVRASDRLLYGDHVFDVRGAMPDRMRRHVLTLECSMRYLPTVHNVRSLVRCLRHPITIGGVDNG